MKGVRRFVSFSKSSSLGTSLQPSKPRSPEANNDEDILRGYTYGRYEPSDSPECFRDPLMVQEILGTIDEDYYSMTFDSGKYEIEQSAGPTCRELAGLKMRLLALEKQNKAVSRRISELILEKHPCYEAELKSVLLLQTDNLKTLELCRCIRQSLTLSSNVLITSRLIVLRNFRRRLRLRNALRVLQQIRTLQNNVLHLDSLLLKGSFHAAIELHRSSLVVLENYRQYRCVEPIHVKLKALGLRIDDLLDSELQISCEEFSPTAYGTVQHAFELLGSTQTTFAQLQMHYIAAIHRQSTLIVQAYSATNGDADQTVIDSSGYANLCLELPLESLSTCLAAVCQKLWSILLCYHRSTGWHKSRASDDVTGTGHKVSSELSVSGSLDSGVLTEPKSPLNGDDEVICHPQLARHWHDYVASKLEAGRSRIWSEMTSHVEPILKAMDQMATEMSFDYVLFILHTINHFVKIGEEFCGCLSSDILEILRISIHKFFKVFHGKHLDRLRLFLENETWELCPVSSSFTILDLQEYRAVSDLFIKQENSDAAKSITEDRQQTNLKNESHGKSFFEPPYQFLQFQNTSLPMDKATSNESVAKLTENGNTTGVTIPTRHGGPVFPSTALEVLRMIGRYLQMMRLLQLIATDVMHCLCQVFDYYLYSIFVFFGPMHLLDTTELPERLRLNLKRISERLIGSEDDSAVTKGDRFLLPSLDCTHTLKSAPWSGHLQAHWVGVESVICLAEILEMVLLPHLSNCLPERKRGLTSVFREQSLTAARQLKEPCAIHLAPFLISKMMPFGSPTRSQTEVASSASSSSFSKMWSAASSRTANQGDRESISSVRSLSSSPNATPDIEMNLLVPHVTAATWTTKQVAAHPNSYVNQLHHLVFLPFSTAVQSLARRLGLTEASKLIIWNGLLISISNMLLNAYAHVHLCSEEGRGQMLLDVQSIAVFAETVSKVRPFPKLDHVIEYIQAFYIPVHEWEHWLSQTGVKYNRTQLTGLAHCLARGDRRQKQRLLSAINQTLITSSPLTASVGNNSALQ